MFNYFAYLIFNLHLMCGIRCGKACTLDLDIVNSRWKKKRYNIELNLLYIIYPIQFVYFTNLNN